MDLMKSELFDPGYVQQMMSDKTARY